MNPPVLHRALPRGGNHLQRQHYVQDPSARSIRQGDIPAHMRHAPSHVVHDRAQGSDDLFTLPETSECRIQLLEGGTEALLKFTDTGVGLVSLRSHALCLLSCLAGAVLRRGLCPHAGKQLVIRVLQSPAGAAGKALALPGPLHVL
jgi:hypothetical protein